LKQYLKLSQYYQVSPLPLLNKLEHKEDAKVLALEDYSINEGQIKSLSKVLDLFGPTAFTKLYFNNNGLTDKSMSHLFKGSIKNKYITEIEILKNCI
jgi:hypothetical protein